LINGKILVTGGVGVAITALNSAELYDPSTGTWTTTGVMNQVRKWHTSSVLTDGKVLVIGGSNDTVSLNSAELYDPLTTTWRTVANMNNTRYYPTSSVLTNGKVLVAGGFGDRSYPNTAELYYSS
jgi:N-acetylneuraminic acid mutarotase